MYWEAYVFKFKYICCRIYKCTYLVVMNHSLRRKEIVILCSIVSRIVKLNCNTAVKSTSGIVWLVSNIKKSKIKKENLSYSSITSSLVWLAITGGGDQICVTFVRYSFVVFHIYLAYSIQEKCYLYAWW